MTQAAAERWRIITPIALSTLSILAGINLFVMNDIKQAIRSNRIAIEGGRDRLHALERWQAETVPTRFTKTDWTQQSKVLVTEILEQVSLRVPTKDAMQNISSRMDAINTDLQWLKAAMIDMKRDKR